MGSLLYAKRVVGINIDDRELAHIRVVVLAKLRLNQSFGLTGSFGSGLTCVWLDRAIPLQFVFDSTTLPTLNQAWIEQLSMSANSPGGMVLSAEPVAAPSGAVVS